MQVLGHSNSLNYACMLKAKPLLNQGMASREKKSVIKDRHLQFRKLLAEPTLGAANEGSHPHLGL